MLFTLLTIDKNRYHQLKQKDELMANGAGGNLWIAQVHVSEHQKKEIFFLINGRGDIVGVAFRLADAELIKEQIDAGINATDVDSQLSENLEKLKDRFYVAARPEPIIVGGEEERDFSVIDRDKQTADERFPDFEKAQNDSARRLRGYGL